MKFLCFFVVMLRWISLFMILALQFPLLNQVRILVDFEINRETLTELFCINKEEPITVCGGQCYLAESLNTSAQQEEAPLPRSLEFKSLTLFQPTTHELYSKRSFSADPLIASFVCPFIEQLNSFEIFHPPRIHDQIS